MQRKLLVILVLSLVILSGCSDSDGGEMGKDYTLDISIEKGEGEIKNSGAATSEDREVTLEAIPKDEAGDEYAFDRWAGDIEGDRNPITFVAEEKMQINAYFNDKPNFTSTVTNQQIRPGGEIEFVIGANDSDSDLSQLEYEIVNLHDDLKGDYQFKEDPDNPEQMIFYHPGYGAVGDYEITFKVSDPEDNLETEKTVYIGVNGPPVIESVEQENASLQAANDKGYDYKVLEVTEGEEFLMTIIARDPNQFNQLDYRLEGGISANLKDVTEQKSQLSAQAKTDRRQFSWTPSYDLVQEGSRDYETLITVSDGLRSANRKVIIKVNHQDRPPKLEGVSDISIKEEAEVSFAVIASDPDGDEVTLSAQGLPSGAEFNAQTGEFSWQTEKGETGNYEVTFVAMSKDKRVTKTAQLSVGESNQAPTLEGLTNQKVDEGQQLDLRLQASDADGDDLDYSVSGLPQGANFDQQSGEFSWRPGNDAQGNYRLDFSVSDGKLEDSESMTITVGDVNQPPQLEAIADKRIVEGEELNFKLSGSDPDEDTVSFSAQGLPAGAEFDPAAKEFTWTPNYQQAGGYEVEFSLSDGSLETTKKVKIKVQNKTQTPVLTEIGDQEVNEGEELNFKVEAESPGGENLNYRALNLPQGAEFDQESKEFSWQPSHELIVDNKETKEYRIIFVVEAAGKIAKEEVSIEVQGYDRAPVLEDMDAKSGEEGSEISFRLTASDPDGDEISYSGESLPQGASINEETGEFSWIPNYEQAGDYELTLRATANGKNDTQTVSLTVADVEETEDSPPVLAAINDKTINEGEELSFTVNASDPNGDEITLSAHNLPPEADFNPESGEFIWIPNYERANQQNGIYEVTFKAEANGKSDEQTVVINVNDYLDVEDKAPSIIGLTDKEVDEEQELSFDVTAQDPNGDEITLSASNLPDGAEFDESTGEFLWTPTYQQAGSYEVTFEAEANEKTDSKTITIAVANINRAPQVQNDSARTDEDNSVTIDLLANDSDPDGDSLKIENVTDGSNGTVKTIGDGRVTYSPDQDWNGDDSFSYKVSDGDLTATAKVNVTVNPVDDPPVLDRIGNKEIDEEEKMEFTVSGSDQEGDSMTFSASDLPEGASFADKTFSWQTDSNDIGSYDVTFEVEARGKTDSETITIRVNDELEGGVDPEESPEQPTGLTATYSSGEVELNVDSSTDAAGYMVYRSRESDVATAEPVTDGLVEMPWNDNDVEDQKTYYYWVRAYNNQELSSKLSESAEETVNID